MQPVKNQVWKEKTVLSFCEMCGWRRFCLFYIGLSELVQGGCGSCWAFATTALVEFNACVKSGKKVALR